MQKFKGSISLEEKGGKIISAQNFPTFAMKAFSSSKNACIITGGGPVPPRYNTGMVFIRCPCRKLVKIFENFVSRGWQRLVFFCVNLVL